MDKTSLTLGWLVGRRIAGQRRTQEKQPTAYLYNGIQLPTLPEWDKVAYPYASISSSVFVSVTETKARYLWVYAEPAIATGDPVGLTTVVPKPCLRWKLKDNMWVEDLFDGDTVLDSKLAGLWSNYDIYYVDDATAGDMYGFEPGSIYKAASDPIPVYE